MANDNGGWNQLSRNPNGFMTNQFNVGNGISFHDTINVNRNGDITKFHTTFNAGNQSLKVYGDGNNSLKK